MRKLYILLCAACVIFGSCDFIMRHHGVNGNGDLQHVSRDISNADKIKVSDGIDVVIKKGSPKLELEADENLLKYIETRVHDGWIEIRTRKDYQLHSKNKITAYVTVEALRALKVAGSSDVSSDEEWNTDGTFKLDVAGSGDVMLNIKASYVDANIGGSGNIELGGDANRLSVDIGGSGSFKGYSLRCNAVDISVAGSGEAEVFAEEKLKVSIAGSGDVKYHGDPTVSKSVAGSGNIEKTD